MTITRNVGMILLAAFLIVTGLVPLLGLEVAGLGTIMAVLALAAGVFILLER